MPASERWAGVDVGARKGFDVAVIDERGLVAGPIRLPDHRAAASWLRKHGPRVVAVDSPRVPAPDGERSRSCERDLVGARVCGIRYTPDAAALNANPTYYGWILNGLRLYETLNDAAVAAAWRVIECFPTATWSRLGGRRGRARSRAGWSRDVLDALHVDRLPARMNQDSRDAVGAALTARLHDQGRTESFGEIVVPVARPR